MTYKENYYFIGQCLSLDEHPATRESIVKRIKVKDLPWEELMQMGKDHMVQPAIYLKLKAHDLLKMLPHELTEALKAIYDVNLLRNEKILLQIDRLTAALHARQIYPVFLKGTANLLDGLYSDFGEGIIHNIDFLVTNEDYLRTAIILERMDYQHNPYSYMDFKNQKHYPCLYKDGEPAVVEIHRVAVPFKYSRGYNSQELFNHKTPVAGRPGVHVPSDKHKLIHTFIHNQLSGKGNAYKLTSLWAFNDLFLLSKRMQISALPAHTSFRSKAISWLETGSENLIQRADSTTFKPNRLGYMYK